MTLRTRFRRQWRSLLVVLTALLTDALPAQSVPVRRVVEAFRLGGADAPEPFALARAPRLAVDAGGTIFARLASDGVVLVLSPDGQLVRKIGRLGAGPGEFQVALEHGFLLARVPP